MKPAKDWRTELANLHPDPRVEPLPGRAGEPTVKVDNVLLHSRYQPREEARRVVESAALTPSRPVLCIGTGLGYHVAELRKNHARVAAVEPLPAVARLAIEGPLRDLDILLGVGEIDQIAGTDAFKAFADELPQLFIHPPTARVHPEFCEQVTAAVSKAALGNRRLRIAVIGPMYGGSLPIADYLERAFASLGHATLLVDNSQAWGLYKEATTKLDTKRAKEQLGTLLGHFLSEWSYARAAEFAPDICIVIAQAPVAPGFPARLAQEGIVTAFWYVENWRHLPYWKDIAPRYDYFFHIQPGEFEKELTRIGCAHHAYVQTGCDPEIHKPIALTPEEQEAVGCDVSFAGAGYQNRVELFKGLTDYNFKIWGVEWGARELLPHLCCPDQRYTPEFFAQIVAASKINLNLHSSTTALGVDPKCDAINPRVFEIAACGGFQLCDPCIGLDSLFDFDSELPVYHDLKELRARMDYFLAQPDERQQVAGRARARVLRDHTYKHRAQQMLDLIIEKHGPRLLRKGIRVQRSMAEMAERLGKESPLGQYLSTLPPDMLFTHENINSLLAQPADVARPSYPGSYPEQLFRYLREVRNFAENLLALRP